MKSDSYPRYVRSEMYRDFLNGSKKKVIVSHTLFVVITYISVHYCFIQKKKFRHL